MDLEKFARALRLRWLCYEWVAPNKSWVGLETPNDQQDRDLFNAATKVTIGNGKKASFWSSSWLNGFAPKSLAPLIFAVSKRKNKCVHDALRNLSWIRDIPVQNFTVDHCAQFVNLWELLQGIGWPHSPQCPLFQCQPETARHILFECRFSRRIWQAAASWLSSPDLLQNLGSGRPTVLQYWQAIVNTTSANPKGLKSVVVLMPWEISKERNARVFNNKFTAPLHLFQKIKDESKDWILAGVRHLAENIS